jgi:hypothetical protein
VFTARYNSNYTYLDNFMLQDVRHHLEDPGEDGRIILRCIFRKWDGAWTRLIWLRIREVVGDCECGNEPSGSIKCGELC